MTTRIVGFLFALALAVSLTGCFSITSYDDFTDHTEDYLSVIESNYPELVSNSDLRARALDIGYQHCDGLEEFGADTWLTNLFNATEDEYVELTATVVVAASSYLCPEYRTAVAQWAEN